MSLDFFKFSYGILVGLCLLFFIPKQQVLAQSTNTAHGFEALQAANATALYPIERIDVVSSGYAYPTLSFNAPVEWLYKEEFVGLEYYSYGELKTTTALTSATLTGGHGNGNITFYNDLYDFDGTYYYYYVEVYGATGYVPQITINPVAQGFENYQYVCYLNPNGTLSVYYHDYNKLNTYSTAPQISFSFGNAVGTAVLSGTPANGENTGVGYQALKNNTSSKNIAIGFKALSSSTTGVENIAFGYEVGKTLSTGNKNVFLGHQAGNGITTGSGNTIIGGANGTLTSNLSSTVIIADGYGNPRLYSSSSGNVMIGYGNNPTLSNFKLDVNGTGRFTGNLTTRAGDIKVFRGLAFYKRTEENLVPEPVYPVYRFVTFPTIGNDLFIEHRFEDGTYNAPFQLRHSDGKMIINGVIPLGNNGSEKLIVSKGLANESWYNAAFEAQGVNPGYAFHHPGYYGASLWMDMNGRISWGGTHVMVPNGLVSSAAGFQNTSFTSGRNRIWSFSNADEHGLSYHQSSNSIYGRDGLGIHFGNSLSPLFNFLDNGNLGIGTTNPTEVLHLRASSPVVRYEKSGILNWRSGNIQGNDFSITADNILGTAFTIESGSGNIGIGTTSITRPLTVTAGDDYISSFFKGGLLSGGNYFSSILTGYNDFTVNQAAQFGYVYNPTIPLESYAHITPYGSPEGAFFNVKANGNIGIGTTTPTAKLHVSGTIRVDGNTTYKGDDAYSIYQKSDGVSVLYQGLERAAFGGASNDGISFVYGPHAYHIATNSAKRLTVTGDGNIGIGTTNPGTDRLAVNGNIKAKAVKVDPNAWPDYVFDTNYPLLSLKDTEAFIHKNKHLPEVPSASEVAARGHDLGEMNTILLKKIEELTLYIIEQDKRIKKLEDAQEANPINKP